MELLERLLAIKDNANLVVFPLLMAAFLSYFPASNTVSNDVAWLYDTSPILGVIANLILSFFCVIFFYIFIFSICNYFESYHSIPIFYSCGIFLLAIAFFPLFKISDFMWVKPPLSYALSALAMNFFSVSEKK